MIVSIEKQYRTRSGRAVRLTEISTLGTAFPVVGKVLHDTGEWTFECWDLDGSYFGGGQEFELDLVEIEPTGNGDA